MFVTCLLVIHDVSPSQVLMDKRVGLKRYELNGRKVLFYFDEASYTIEILHYRGSLFARLKAFSRVDVGAGKSASMHACICANVLVSVGVPLS